MMMLQGDGGGTSKMDTSSGFGGFPGQPSSKMSNSVSVPSSLRPPWPESMPVFALETGRLFLVGWLGASDAGGWGLGRPFACRSLSHRSHPSALPVASPPSLRPGLPPSRKDRRQAHQLIVSSPTLPPAATHSSDPSLSRSSEDCQPFRPPSSHHFAQI